MGEVDEESFAGAYESLIAKARQTGAAVVAMTIPDLNAAPGIPPQRRAAVASRVEKFNLRIEEAAARSGLSLVDLYRAGGKKPEVGSNFFSPDGLHPSDEGYAFWAEALWEKIGPALGGR
jgi:lysophospholipase L1-like esterase